MAGGFIVGTDQNGNGIPVRVDARGRLRLNQEDTLTDKDDEIVLQLRAVRIGFEMLLNLNPGDLVNLARSEIY